MSCNCQSDNIVTLDMRQIVGHLTSETGIASAQGQADISALAEGDYAYHHLDNQSWLTSAAVKAGGAEGRTVKGVVDGLEFDYDMTLELRDGVVEVTLAIRKPFEFSVTVEIDLKTGRWNVKQDTMQGTAEVGLQGNVGTLGCGKWCIIRCVGFAGLKCIWCGPAWPCWVACLKTSAPGVAVCVARCCS